MDVLGIVFLTYLVVGIFCTGVFAICHTKCAELEDRRRILEEGYPPTLEQLESELQQDNKTVIKEQRGLDGFSYVNLEETE